MTTPQPPRSRPDRSVSRENSFNMAEAFDALSENITALNETMRRTSEEFAAALDMQGRFGFGPDTQIAYQARQRIAHHTPEITREALMNMRQHFGITNDLTLGMTKLTGLEATTSLAHARAYVAQRLGEVVAGGPLYSTPPGTPTSSGAPARPSGGTPAGQPTTQAGGFGGGRRGGGGGPPVGGTSAPGPINPSGNWGFGYGGQNARPHSPAMQALGARIATSGGHPSHIMHAVRHLPYVGLATDIIEKSGQQYQEQREKGRQYQEIEGGTNLQAQLERGHEEVYRLGMGFGMSEQAARAAFYGVTELGYNRRAPQGTLQNRQDALNFVYHNYNNRGMDVGESMRVLEEASRNATISFGALSTALKDVSDTAGAAGVNAKAMRAQFTQNLGEAITAGAGQGAPALAQALTSTQASYGRMFENQNFGNQLNQTQTYMVGGRYGLSPGQTQYIMRNNPQEYTRMLTGNSQNVVRQLQGMTAESYQDLQNMIQQYGGPGTIDEQKAADIGNNWLNKWQPRMNIDLGVWADVINQMTGLQLDPNSVMSWVVQQVAGNTVAAHAASQKNSMAPVKTTDAYGNVSKSSGAATGKGGLFQTGHLPGDTPQPLNDLRDINAGRHWWGGKSANHAAVNYINQAKKSHSRDPVLEALLQNVKDPNNTHVQVSTKSGQRVVSFADAMKYFPEELASGNAMFVDGPDAGRRPQDITGGAVDTSRSTTSELTSNAGGKVGQSLADWQKANPTKKNAISGNVTVDLTPEAKRLLQLLPSNNNPAAGAATVPQNPNAQYGSRGH